MFNIYENGGENTTISTGYEIVSYRTMEISLAESKNMDNVQYCDTTIKKGKVYYIASYE